MANSYKNAHHKSAVQFYGTTPQEITADSLINNPITVLLGNKVTDTGVALDFDSNEVDIKVSGLYRISADLDVQGSTGGAITLAFTLNGQIMPETIRTITAVAEVTEVVTLETVRALRTCCTITDYNVGLIAYSDGTAAADINRISGNVIKLA